MEKEIIIHWLRFVGIRRTRNGQLFLKLCSGQNKRLFSTNCLQNYGNHNKINSYVNGARTWIEIIIWTVNARKFIELNFPFENYKQIRHLSTSKPISSAQRIGIARNHGKTISFSVVFFSFCIYFCVVRSVRN